MPRGVLIGRVARVATLPFLNNFACQHIPNQQVDVYLVLQDKGFEIQVSEPVVEDVSQSSDHQSDIVIVSPLTVTTSQTPGTQVVVRARAEYQHQDSGQVQAHDMNGRNPGSQKEEDMRSADAFTPPALLGCQGYVCTGSAGAPLGMDPARFGGSQPKMAFPQDGYETRALEQNGYQVQLASFGQEHQGWQQLDGSAAGAFFPATSAQGLVLTGMDGCMYQQHNPLLGSNVDFAGQMNGQPPPDMSSVLADMTSPHLSSGHATGSSPMSPLGGDCSRSSYGTGGPPERQCEQMSQGSQPAESGIPSGADTGSLYAELDAGHQLDHFIGGHYEEELIRKEMESYNIPSVLGPLVTTPGTGYDDPYFTCGPGDDSLMSPPSISGAYQQLPVSTTAGQSLSNERKRHYTTPGAYSRRIVTPTPMQVQIPQHHHPVFAQTYQTVPQEQLPCRYSQGISADHLAYMQTDPGLSAPPTYQAVHFTPPLLHQGSLDSGLRAPVSGQAPDHRAHEASSGAESSAKRRKRSKSKPDQHCLTANRSGRHSLPVSPVRFPKSRHPYSKTGRPAPLDLPVQQAVIARYQSQLRSPRFWMSQESLSSSPPPYTPPPILRPVSLPVVCHAIAVTCHIHFHWPFVTVIQAFSRWLFAND